MVAATGVAPTDPRTVIDGNPMTTRQWIVVALMTLLNALDGFDVLASAFAGPGIRQEWGLPPDALGVVLSAELVGMGLGSLFLGGLADQLGRRTMLLSCLLVMTAGMFMAAFVGSVPELIAWRLLTGLGIGGMLAATNAVTAECTSRAARAQALAIYVIGYPLGAVIGGFAAQGWLLVEYDWRAVFLFGGAATAAMIPLTVLLVPETPAFFAAKRPPDALARINRSLRSLRQPPIADLPPPPPAHARPRASDVLAKPALRRVTVLLSLGYMCHTLTFYFILKWAVTIVADAGFSQPEAASVLTWANIGGAIGGTLFGLFLRRFDIKGPTIAASLLGAAAVVGFGTGADSLWGWRALTFASMFFLNAAIVGYYAAFARGFPAYARGTGSGIALGVGRAGAAASPIVAGLLFTALGDAELPVVAAIMAVGAVCGAALLWLLPLTDPEQDEAIP
ncbi:MFS transporter [Croceibacterium sp. TMG7-5b_MA50]|uniref:MFS transporter n=1 Tax=Croceibacterium sp. TMG7-5b_MA50 TaxID=3121290 RepID=UPI003221FC10